MRFSTQALFAVLASPLLALAASDANPFNNPDSYNITAGQSTTLKWTPTTSGTISLVLRSGSSNDLIAGTYIAQNVTNSGSYTWAVDSTITRGSDYTVEIVDDTDNSQVNFTPYFVIESTNTVASTTSDIALGAAAATTASVSSATSASGATLTGTSTNGGSSASSAVSSVNSSISSARSSLSSVVSSASSSASKAASSASSSASKAASSSASAASTSASSTVSNSGAVATVLPAAGLMGVLALGAFVL